MRLFIFQEFSEGLVVDHLMVEVSTLLSVFVGKPGHGSMFLCITCIIFIVSICNTFVLYFICTLHCIQLLPLPRRLCFRLGLFVAL